MTTKAFSLFSHTEANAVRSGGKVEHIALRVTGYDLDAKPSVVIGNRLDNGEEVRISLDADRVSKKHKTTSKKAPCIEHLAGLGQGQDKKRTVHEGGIVLMNAVFENNGNLSADWVSTLHHGSDEANETMGVLGYYPANFSVWTKKDTGKQGAYVNVLLTDDRYFETLSPTLKEHFSKGGQAFSPKLYTDLDKVRKYAEILFERGFGAVIRARFKESVEGTYNVLAVDTKPTYGNNIESATDWYNKRVAKFLENDTIKGMLAKGELDIEVVPVFGVFSSSNINSELETPRWRGLRDKYTVTTSEGLKRLYIPSFISIFQHPDSPAIVLSTLSPQVATDAYIGMDGAGFYVETEHGKGTDEGVVAAGLNPTDFFVKYVKQTRNVNAHENSALAEAAQSVVGGGKPAPQFEPPVDNFDDDIPF